jgi:hypothetical protein
MACIAIRKAMTEGGEFADENAQWIMAQPEAAREEALTVAHNDEAATLHYRVILALQERRIGGESHGSIAKDYKIPVLVVESICNAIDQTLFPQEMFHKCPACDGVVCSHTWTGTYCVECAAREERDREWAKKVRAIHRANITGFKSARGDARRKALEEAAQLVMNIHDSGVENRAKRDLCGRIARKLSALAHEGVS